MNFIAYSGKKCKIPRFFDCNFMETPLEKASEKGICSDFFNSFGYSCGFYDNNCNECQNRRVFIPYY